VRCEAQGDKAETEVRQTRHYTKGKAGRGKGKGGVKVGVRNEVEGRGVLIDDVEKQRLAEVRAPCLNQRRQTRTGARYARRSLAKPRQSNPANH
jgi:hypothetical protein